jgi:hypothetical protein
MILRSLEADDEAELLRIHRTPEVVRWWGEPAEGFPWTDEPESTRMAIEIPLLTTPPRSAPTKRSASSRSG